MKPIKTAAEYGKEGATKRWTTTTQSQRQAIMAPIRASRWTNLTPAERSEFMQRIRATRKREQK